MPQLLQIMPVGFGVEALAMLSGSWLNAVVSFVMPRLPRQAKMHGLSMFSAVMSPPRFDHIRPRIVRLLHELRATWLLALPLVLGQLSAVALSVVDTLLAGRHGALTLAGVAVGEIRGISNLVGNRDRAAWRVREAAEAAQMALLEWITRRV